MTNATFNLSPLAESNMNAAEDEYWKEMEWEQSPAATPRAESKRRPPSTNTRQVRQRAEGKENVPPEMETREVGGLERKSELNVEERPTTPPPMHDQAESDDDQPTPSPLGRSAFRIHAILADRKATRAAVEYGGALQFAQLYPHLAYVPPRVEDHAAAETPADAEALDIEFSKSETNEVPTELSDEDLELALRKYRYFNVLHRLNPELAALAYEHRADLGWTSGDAEEELNDAVSVDHVQSDDELAYDGEEATPTGCADGKHEGNRNAGYAAQQNDSGYAGVDADVEHGNDAIVVEQDVYSRRRIAKRRAVDEDSDGEMTIADERAAKRRRVQAENAAASPAQLTYEIAGGTQHTSSNYTATTAEHAPSEDQGTDEIPSETHRITLDHAPSSLQSGFRVGLEPAFEYTGQGRDGELVQDWREQVRPYDANTIQASISRRTGRLVFAKVDRSVAWQDDAVYEAYCEANHTSPLLL